MRSCSTGCRVGPPRRRTSSSSTQAFRRWPRCRLRSRRSRSSVGTAALIAMGDNSPELDEQYREIGSAAGYYDDYQAGRDPAGISTQDEELAARLDPVVAGRRVANYLRVMTLEAQTLARACGKSHVHNLEPEDLVALTVEAAAMARVPLAGTSWVPGRTDP